MKFLRLKALFAITAMLTLALNAKPNDGFGVGFDASNCENNGALRADLVSQVQQRFYAFQDATSYLKQVAHSPNPALLQEALDVFITFFNPNQINFLIDTSSQFGPWTDTATIRGFYEAVSQFFNGWSQHFSTNVVVVPVAGSNCLQALMTSGGGEWASLNPALPNEQITISNWVITWTFLPDGPTGADWYITDYLEVGNRQFRICPPTGPITLAYSRTFTGATPEATVDYICTGSTGPGA